jgi:hypothetical protein
MIPGAEGIRPVKVRGVDSFHGRGHGARDYGLNIPGLDPRILQSRFHCLINQFGIAHVIPSPATRLPGSDNPY